MLITLIEYILASQSIGYVLLALQFMLLGLELIHNTIQCTFVEEVGKERKRKEEREGRGREKGKRLATWILCSN